MFICAAHRSKDECRQQPRAVLPRLAEDEHRPSTCERPENQVECGAELGPRRVEDDAVQQAQAARVDLAQQPLPRPLA